MPELDFKALYNLQSKKEEADKSDIINPLKETEELGALQKKANEIQKDHERAKRIFETYDNNRKLTQRLRIELMQGVREGQNIYLLFLKAIKLIDLLVSDKAFYNTIEADIKTLYTDTFKEPQSIEQEAERVNHRLNTLNEALTKATGRGERGRIKRAIKEHERILKDLTKKNTEKS